MDKSNFKKMAMMGLAGGLMLTSQSAVNAEVINSDSSQVSLAAQGCGSKCSGSQYRQGSCGGSSRPRGMGSNYTADASTDEQQQMNQQKRMMSESEFTSQLSGEAKSMYMSMDADGKALAMKFANEGMDKNQAVKMAQKKMIEKRTMSGHSSNSY